MNTIEQQIKLLSITLATKSQSSVSHQQGPSAQSDPRISSDQACTMIVGLFPDSGSEIEYTKWCIAEIAKLNTPQQIRSHIKGSFRNLLWFIQKPSYSRSSH